MRSQTKDTRLLVAGVVAFLALVVYLSVAFAGTHAITSVTAPQVNKLAPYVASNSKLVAIPRRQKDRYTVHVTAAGPGYYGALVPTLISQPEPGKYEIGFSLRGALPGRIGIELDEFRPGRSPKLLDIMVPAPVRWRHFRFTRQVRGRWLGVGLFVYRRAASRGSRQWFEIRGLTVR